MSRTRKALRAVQRALLKGVAALRFGGGQSGWWPLRSGASGVYAAQVGDGTGNSAVMACVLWIARTFPEAPLRVSKRATDGTLDLQPEHPLVELLDRPNPYYSGALLWMATLADFTATGNAYWLKIRSGGGRVVQLWWLPSWMVEPKWPSDGTVFISHYEYRPGGSVPIHYDPADIVHFRFSFDPRNPRKGLSQLASVLRELYVDEEAASFAAALLHNLGIPGVVISPADDAGSIDAADAEAIKSEFGQKFGGDNRGATMVMPAKIKVDVLSFSPEQMNLTALRRLPEERVTAVLGIPAIVAGLGAGLDRSTFANFKEAREAAYESNIIPTQRLLAADVKAQLLSDFGETRRMVVDFDLSQVRVLQDDQSELYRRTDIAVRGGWATVGEGRSAVGLPAGPEHDYYLRSLTVEAIKPGEEFDLPEPAPVPQLPMPAADEDDDGDEMMAAGLRLTERKGAVQRTRQRTTLRLERRFARDLRGQFGRQQTAVLAVWARSGARTVTQTAGRNGTTATVATKEIAAELLPEEWDTRLSDVAARFYRAVGDEAVSLAEAELGIEGLFDLASDRLEATYATMAEQVTAVNETTREELRAAIRAGIDRGYTLEQIAQGVPGDGYGGIRGVMERASAARARMIARTETAIAMNNATIDAYTASEVVEGVDVVDGDQDDACAAANGARWTLDEARANPTSHPNCTRGFSPVIGSRD